MSRANLVFDGINQMKESAAKHSPEDFDFFLTAGDNVYPIIPSHPTDLEFHRMFELFDSRSSLKSIPIYPVRGNHDCLYSDEQREVDLSKKHSNWKFNEYYY